MAYPVLCKLQMSQDTALIWKDVISTLLKGLELTPRSEDRQGLKC